MITQSQLQSCIDTNANIIQELEKQQKINKENCKIIFETCDKNDPNTNIEFSNLNYYRDVVRINNRAIKHYALLQKILKKQLKDLVKYEKMDQHIFDNTYLVSFDPTVEKEDSSKSNKSGNLITKSLEFVKNRLNSFKTIGK